MSNIREKLDQFIYSYIMPTHAKKPLPKAEGDKCFWVHEGPVVCSMPELADFMGSISLEQLHYHVGSGRNDFATWVNDVFGDEAAARGLKRAKTARGLQHALEVALRRYEW